MKELVRRNKNVKLELVKLYSWEEPEPGNIFFDETFAGADVSGAFNLLEVLECIVDCVTCIGGYVGDFVGEVVESVKDNFN